MDLPDSGGVRPTRPDPRREPHGPLPDHEFPVWLMRTSRERIGSAVRSLLAGPQYKRLARFSCDMRTCTRSSLDITRALELCLKPLRETPLGLCWSSAARQVQHGSTLAAALQPGEKALPAFYLPVIEAGEEVAASMKRLSFWNATVTCLPVPPRRFEIFGSFPVFCSPAR